MPLPVVRPECGWTMPYSCTYASEVDDGQNAVTAHNTGFAGHEIANAHV